MRRWTSFVALCLLPLAFYDTFYQLQIDQADAISIWTVRFTGLVCGLMYYVLSFKPKYNKHIQLISSIMLTIIGMTNSLSVRVIITNNIYIVLYYRMCIYVYNWCVRYIL